MSMFFDVVIVGGGPAGLAAACSLGQRQLTVAVIELSDYSKVRVGEHLSPQGIGLLQQLNFPIDYLDTHQNCYSVSSCWSTQALEVNDYMTSPPGFGKNLSRPLFDQQFAQFAQFAQGNGVRIFSQSQLIKTQMFANQWSLLVNINKEQQTLTTRFVVDATGRSAMFARLQGSHIEKQDEQVGIAALLTSQKPVQIADSLLIEADEQGWWYFARLSEKNAICTFSTDVDYIKAAKNNKALDLWHERLSAATHLPPLVANYILPQSVVVRSARSQVLDKMIGDQWLAMGDAAMSFDPLSSMGITKALEDGIEVSQIISSNLKGKMDSLNDYQQNKINQFKDYRKIRQQHYNGVLQWPDANFWSRRQSR
jgi:2-polyprenyl-6-methoxyphenol hydroxylase-like FAD-dependent oxidoreductase